MRGVLYGNVRVRGVEMSQLSGILTVNAIFAERERQSAVYTEVLYSQLDESAEGKSISVVVELSPEELRDGGHQSAVDRLLCECGLNSLESIEEISRRGYRLFLHFVGEKEEYIVIAKGLRVG